MGCTALLTAGDQFHTQFEVIAYPTPMVFGQAWWVAPGFAVAVIGLVAIAWPFASAIASVPTRSLVVDAAWFFGIYAASGAFGTRSVALALVFTATWALRMAWRRDRRRFIGFSLLLALLGTVGEEILHATGVCRYNVRDLGLVPLWLPALWLHGAPFALGLGRWLRDGQRAVS